MKFKTSKLLSTLTSIGIAGLVLLPIIAITHLITTGGGNGVDYFKGLLVPAILSVLLIAGSFIYKKVSKFEENSEDLRAELENFLNTHKLESMNQNKKDKAFSLIKRRNAIDFVASQITSISFVFILDYIFFIKKFSATNVVADMAGAFTVSFIFVVIAFGIHLIRDNVSDDYSGYALGLLKSATVADDDSSIITMKERDISNVARTQKVMQVLGKIALYLFLGVMALIVIFPFYWMIISSLKTTMEYEQPIPTLFPKVIMWSNYSEAIKVANLYNLFKNTVIVGIVSTILSLVITVITAFVFARLEFKGRDALFALLLATMMIPGELFTITNYVTVTKWGWVGKGVTPIEGYSVLIVPFLVSIFYIYLLRQNFLQIPNELYLAAKIDGTKDLKYLWKVMIPLALPTLISITILKMMGAWNSYVWPRLVTTQEYYLITNGLRTAFKDANTNTSNIPQQMAAVTMVSIPLFLVFIFLRKYIMKGVSRSGIKG